MAKGSLKSDVPMMRIEYMPLSTILRAPRNMKQHDLGAIHESVKRFGYVQPILLNDKSGKIVAGHGRLDTLQQAKASGQPPPERIIVKDGEWLVPVIRGVEFANDVEAEAYLVADNRLVELGGWDEKSLAEVLSDHAAMDSGLAGMGYDAQDLDKMIRAINSDAESGAAAQSQTVQAQFLVLVTCTDEDAQMKLIERLMGEGFEVKAMVG